MTEYESPSENPEYKRKLKKLEEKETRALEKYKIAKQNYTDASRELDEVFEEIGLLNGEYGIYQNVR